MSGGFTSSEFLSLPLWLSLLQSTGWRYTSPMANGRFMSDSVILPDGTIFVVNGASRGLADDSFDPVLQSELFDPETETWRGMAN